MSFITINTPETIQGKWQYNKNSHIVMGSDAILQTVTFHLRKKYKPNSKALFQELDARVKDLQRFRQLN